MDRLYTKQFKEVGRSNLITLVIALVSLGLAFYAVFLQPKSAEQKQESLLSMKMKCQDIGNKLYEQDIKELKESLINITPLNPEFTYNKKVDTCLYSGGIISGDGTIEKWVRDGLTNKNLLLYEYYYNSATGKSDVLLCDICASTQQEFDNLKQELFNE